MTLQQFEYIIALDEYRHYVTAAEHCYVSQPNLTMQVKKLEVEIGVRIFDRDKKPLQPTEIGKEIILRARQILRESKQLKEFVTHEKETLEGEYTVGIIPTLAPYLLPQFLPSFIKENPKIHLKIRELQTSQIISQLENGIIDIGILVTPLNESAIREIPVFYEPFLLYLPEHHRLLNEKLMLAEDLDPSEVLVLDEGHCFREQALSICKGAKHGSSIGFEYQSGSIEALKSLVQKGVGYTLVPELSVSPAQDDVHIRRFTNPQPVREVSIVVHNSYIKESVIERLKETIQKVIPTQLLEKQSIVDFDWN
ncbi:LysR family transcriptional regulator, hydrogen peroxide-inducible genes activator [Reichenbachiella faecimaris]|uniref:LysR family transcriptional regulator, hydrogen peroxide-inducible genes activator n=1 Tax=Reichenbachiella faecimaris TaxID=692418 RepID=A0A1W2GDK8_REIFA|nr:LysR substrate-binding domain-containing protein [Reichenbachiella faecimaris]SMD34681.1 LysR family transcriptional regulator, hydrogen peroxide-inducible genes activator [Reichenbachiella faecimaris]